MSTIKTKYESVLRLKSLICLKTYTNRIDGREIDEELEMAINNKGTFGEDEVTVDVGVSIYSKGKSFEAEVVMRGIFEIPNLEDDKLREKLIKQNTVAIIFPYIRSQITLITSQPGMSPVIIPTINVTALMDDVASEDAPSN